MKQVVVLLAVLCVCDGVKFGQICSGNPNNTMRSSDQYGQGHYGAPRGPRVHRGVDIVCQDGSDVFAPFNVTLNGRLTPFSDPRMAPINDGINLSGEGLCVQLISVRPTGTAGTLLQGERLGVMLPMQSVFPNITPHVHVQLCDQTDPTPYL